MKPCIRNLTWSVAGVVAALVGLPGVTAPSGAAAQEGKWVSLFDGKTLSGWTALETGKKKGESKWEVKDGVIEGSGMPSMLFSPRGDYRNFRYRAELKINEGGNSGMYIRTPMEATFSKGYEVQVNSTHRDPIKTGSIYTYVHIFKQLVPPDTFFTQEIECIDKMYRGKIVTHIKVTINGEILHEFLDHERAWKEGHFAFQQHDPGSRVSIRKIEVMELPAAE